MTAPRMLLIILALTLAAPAAAQTQVSVVDSQSRLWIEGRSTVNEFECVAGQLDGQAVVNGGKPEAEVVVPVDSFDCGKSRMNRDFYDALKADAHPNIVFELTSADLSARTSTIFTVRVHGRLTIAGVTRTVTLQSEGRKQQNGRFRVTGRIPLSMRDFDIEPPTALAGLIKAHERIVVHFDLVATVDHGATAGRCGVDPDIFC